MASNTLSFNLIRSPSPKAQPRDADPVKQHELYQYRQRILIFGMLLTNSVCYSAWRTLNFQSTTFISEGNYTKDTFGSISSAITIWYAISKFIAAPLADWVNLRYMMTLGILATGLCNLFFSWSHSLLAYVAIWSVNGFFQGFAWPPTSRLLAVWFPAHERGTWWSIVSASRPIVGVLLSLAVPYLGGFMSWREVLMFPACVGIASSLLVYVSVRDSPESLGLPNAEEDSRIATPLKARPKALFASGGDARTPSKTTVSRLNTPRGVKDKSDSRASGEDHSEQRAARHSTPRVIRDEKKVSPLMSILGSWTMWELAIISALVLLVRSTSDWVAFFMKDHDFAKPDIAWCVSFLELGQFLGTLSSGVISDKIFMGRRAIVNLLFMLCAVVGNVGMSFMPHEWPLWMFAGASFLFGYGISGPATLIGMVAGELADKSVSASAGGFVGGFGYIGAALGGQPYSKFIMHFGWGAVAWAQVAVGVTCLVFMVNLMVDENKRRRAKALAEAASPDPSTPPPHKHGKKATGSSSGRDKVD